MSKRDGAVQKAAEEEASKARAVEVAHIRAEKEAFGELCRREVTALKAAEKGAVRFESEFAEPRVAVLSADQDWGK